MVKEHGFKGCGLICSMQAYSLEKISKQLELEMIEQKDLVDKLRYDYSIVVRH